MGRAEPVLRLAATLFVVAAAPQTGGATDLPDPAAPDSHEQFLERLRGAEDQAFRQLWGRYDLYLATHPWDVAAAVERCRFLALASCDEELDDCPYRDQHERCVSRLRARHPRSPAVLLYELEGQWGDEGIQAARALLDGEARRWDARRRAIVHARLAQLYGFQQDDAGVVEHALEAMELDPSQDLSLLAARALASRGETTKAVDVLLSRRNASSDYWARIQKVGLLADLGAYTEAALLLDRTEPPDGVEPDLLLLARVWAETGRIDQAREALVAASRSPSMQWQADRVHRERFRLELTHGDPASAIAYYDAFRDTGFSADPFLRHRLQLALRHPGAPWRTRDLLGALAIAGLLVLMAAVPGVVLLPIHYVGLLRARARPDAVPRRTRWRLRHAWYVLALLLLSEVPFLYLDGVGVLDDWASLAAGRVVVQDVDYASIPTSSLALGGLLGTLVLLVGLLPVLRRADLARLTRGTWTLPRTIGLSALGLVAIRSFLVVWVLAMPGSVREALASTAGGPLSLMVIDMCRAIGSLYGLPVLFVFVVLAVPVCEEIVFRGVLLEAFGRYLKPGWANFAQASLFASLHEAWALLPFFLAMGLVTGSLARRSGGLLAPILLHAGNNGLVFVLLAQQLSGAGAS